MGRISMVSQISLPGIFFLLIMYAKKIPRKKENIVAINAIFSERRIGLSILGHLSNLENGEPVILKYSLSIICLQEFIKSCGCIWVFAIGYNSGRINNCIM